MDLQHDCKLFSLSLSISLTHFISPSSPVVVSLTFWKSDQDSRDQYINHFLKPLRERASLGYLWTNKVVYGWVIKIFIITGDHLFNLHLNLIISQFMKNKIWNVIDHKETQVFKQYILFSQLSHAMSSSESSCENKQKVKVW